MIPISFVVEPITEHKYTESNGIYVMCKIDEISKYALRNLCERLGVEPADNPHVTIMYSKKAIPTNSINFHRPTFTATCIEVRQWVGHNDKPYTCAILHSEQCVAEHIYYRGLGAEPTFTPYQPHVTLTNEVGMTEEFTQRIQFVNDWLADNPIEMQLTLCWPEDLHSD